MKAILLIGLVVSLYAETFRCNKMTQLDTSDTISITSLVKLNGENATVLISNLGVFHYKLAFITPKGQVSYVGTDNRGHLTYDKNYTNIMLLRDNVSISGCYKDKR